MPNRPQTSSQPWSGRAGCVRKRTRPRVGQLGGGRLTPNYIPGQEGQKGQKGPGWRRGRQRRGGLPALPALPASPIEVAAGTNGGVRDPVAGTAGSAGRVRCVQCGADGPPLQKLKNSNPPVWLHPECRRFWLKDHQPNPGAETAETLPKI